MRIIVMSGSILRPPVYLIAVETSTWGTQGNDLSKYPGCHLTPGRPSLVGLVEVGRGHGPGWDGLRIGGVFFGGVLRMRASLFGVYIRDP